MHFSKFFGTVVLAAITVSATLVPANVESTITKAKGIAPVKNLTSVVPAGYAGFLANKLSSVTRDVTDTVKNTVAAVPGELSKVKEYLPKSPLEARKNKACITGACECFYSDNTRCATVVDAGGRCDCAWSTGNNNHRTKRHCISPTAIIGGRQDCYVD